MKIMHISLASAYTESTGYQDVLLAKYNALAGHEVIVVSDCHMFVDGKYVETEEEDRIIDHGIRLIRYKYDKLFCNFISNKVRKVKKLHSLLEKECPDVILFHNLSGWELKNVARYVKEHPGVIFYADNHGDYTNTATNFLSKYILHRVFYRWIVKKSLLQLNKVFYITEETKDLAMQEYKIPENVMEYLPLGGELVPEQQRNAWRREIREELGVDDDTLVLMHTGKLDKMKKTSVLLEGFEQVNSEKVILLIAGSIPKENEELKEKIDKNKQVRWLGWKSLEELKHYLSASDIYVQPGNQSATMQNAICFGLPVMLYPHKSHLALCKDNVMWIKDSEDIYMNISKVLSTPGLLEELRANSEILAKNVLDYKVLADRITR